MPKLAPPPPVDATTWQALLTLGAQLADLAPWRFAADTEPVGLVNADGPGFRIGHVLANAGEVFAAVTYRRAGPGSRGS